MSKDTVFYTEPGSGTKVAFDDCGATDGEVQFVKLDVGALGTLTPATATTPVPVQQTLVPTDTTSSGNLVMTGANSITGTVSGCSAVTVDVSGTWTGTIVLKGITSTFQGDIYGINLATGLPVQTFTSNGTFLIPCSALASVRASVSVIGTGTAVVAFRANQASFGTLFAPIDIQRVVGTTVDTNSGNSSAGTQRVVLASDQPIVSVDVDKWNGTAPTTATALSDTFSNPTAPPVGAFLLEWDRINSRWTRRPFTAVQTHLASSARTGNTDGSALDVRGARGILAVLSVSAIVSAPSVKLRLVGSTSGSTYYLTPDPTAVTATGTYCYELALGGGGTVAQASTPGVVQRTAGLTPDNVYASIAHGNANSITYAVYLVAVY